MVLWNWWHLGYFIFLPLGQASDPSTFELIQKIHTLQKRLISKTEEVVEKELLLQVAFSLWFLSTASPGLCVLERISYLAALHAPYLTVDGNRDSHIENKHTRINWSFMLRYLENSGKLSSRLELLHPIMSAFLPHPHRCSFVRYS